jgi:hypothetical protein
LNAMKHNLLVYMAGDNDLGAGENSKAVQDIIEMETEGPSENLSIFVQADGNKEGDTVRYKIIKRTQEGSKPESENIASDGFEVDSGSPEALKEFLDIGTVFDDNVKNSLIVWSHGSGQMADPLSKFGGRRPSLFTHHDKDGRKYVAPDWSSNSSLDAQDFTTNDIINQQLSLFGFDACLMASLEVLYELREYAEIFVASLDEVPLEGWPYVEVLKSFKKSHTDDIFWNISKEIVDAYIIFYNAKESVDYVNCTAIRSTILEDFSSTVEMFSKECLSMLDHIEFGEAIENNVLLKAFNECHSVYGPAVDILSIMFYVAKYTDKYSKVNILFEESSKNIANALNQLNGLMENNIYFKETSESSSQKTRCGISVWRLMFRAEWKKQVDHYKTLQFYKKYPSWGNLIMRLFTR